jgi:hypothetical protein
MSSFKKFCSGHDDMPPLWPVAPRWPLDEKLKAMLSSRIELSLDIVEMMAREQRTNIHYSHFTYLMDVCKNSSTDQPLSVTEWAALVLAPAGYAPEDVVSDLGASTQLTHSQFSAELDEKFQCPCGLEISPKRYIPLAKRKCQSCNKPCKSECMCGASYCCRYCLKEDWNTHQTACERLYNSSSGVIWTLNQVEMNETLSESELRAAHGTHQSSQQSSMKQDRNPQPYAKQHYQPNFTDSSTECANCHKKDSENQSFKQCSKCHMVSYCCRECQKSDWKKHKKACQMNVAYLGRA